MSDRLNGYQICRLVTCLHYPYAASMHPSLLSRLGFSYTGRGSEVQCHACNARHSGFRNGDIYRTHQAKSPSCPLLQLMRTRMRFNRSRENEERTRVPSNREYLMYTSREDGQEVMFDRLNPDFSLLDLEGLRLRRYTYFDWPPQYGDKEQLATDGFFYRGFSDIVVCCYCNIGYRAALLLGAALRRVGVCLSTCPYAQSLPI